MAKLCENCGEEMLGAVNICWKCGREHLSMHEPEFSEAELEQGPRANVDLLDQPPPWNWRMDPEFSRWAHRKYPDDVQVVIHSMIPPTPAEDGREIVWVSTNSREGEVFTGSVINDPQKSKAIRQGHAISFMKAGGDHPPMLVRGDIASDLERFKAEPCPECGCVLIRETIAPLPDSPESLPAELPTSCRLCSAPRTFTLLPLPEKPAPPESAGDSPPEEAEADAAASESPEAETADAEPAVAEEPAPEPPRRKGPPLRPRYPTNVGSTGAAWASLVLAIVGALGAFLLPWIYAGQFVPIAATIIAFLGLVLGIWGIYSQRREVAAIGSLLCLLLLLAGGFFLLVDFYTYTYGHAPWAKPVSEEFPLDEIDEGL